jgi:riboflavin kinase
MIRMSPRCIDALVEVARRGALKTWVKVGSASLGEELEVSQQSASRIIIELVENGMLERRGQMLHITSDGEGLLYANFMKYQGLFSGGKLEVTIHGDVVSGLGEGGYYMSLDGYRDQFVEKLRFKPYPGTLNIRVASDDLPRAHALRYAGGTPIKGFVEHGRTFGDVIAHPATLKGVKCTLIFPARGHYTDTVEIVAPDHLRKKLSLKDGDKVTISISVG